MTCFVKATTAEAMYFNAPVATLHTYHNNKKYLQISTLAGQFCFVEMKQRFCYDNSSLADKTMAKIKTKFYLPTNDTQFGSKETRDHKNENKQWTELTKN